MGIQTNYDANICSTIPLHTTSAIQPHAALLVVNLADYNIIQVSSNVPDWLGLSELRLLGHPLEDIVDSTCVNTIRDKQRKSLFKYVVPERVVLIVHRDPKTYLARIHEKENCLLIEIEFINEIRETTSFLAPYANFQEVNITINLASTITELAQVACREIKRLSGFDKVMIYTFDEKWNGLVIGETMEEGMESYLGLKFPSSDVPRQARDLYFRNSYRLIPDRRYRKVTLVPELNPLTNGPTNLTDVKSRSVVDVHLEYLANMNVEASMSTRIIHNELLWGLIACHHRTPKLLTFDECAFFEMISNAISSKLSSLVNYSRANERLRLNALLGRITASLSLYEDLAIVYSKNEGELLQLLGGDGVAICRDGEIFRSGAVPSNAQVNELLKWLRAKDFKVTVDITSLPNAFEPAKEYAAIASGVLILPIQPYDGNFILSFRMEAMKTISWGGDPDTAITFEKNSTRYHPRNSFSIWKETVRHTANPWGEEELIAAERFRNVVVESTLRKLTGTLEHKVAERTAELGVSNQNLSRALEELQELMHVTSHDLQEPVRKIQLFANELEKSPENDKQKNYISKIQKAAHRISLLIVDLVNISKVRRTRAFETCDLRPIVQGVLDNFNEVIIENGIRVSIAPLPRIDAVPEQMEQLFTSMIGNAIKFRSAFGQPEIEVTAEFVDELSLNAAVKPEGRFVRISVIDNGIGFNDKHSNKLFKVFETLHPGEFEGTGSSLAVAKRIVELHNGAIMAQGKENEGAVFTVILPLSQ